MGIFSAPGAHRLVGLPYRVWNIYKLLYLFFSSTLVETYRKTKTIQVCMWRSILVVSGCSCLHSLEVLKSSTCAIASLEHQTLLY